MFRKCIAELIGTMTLVLIGCGSAMMLLDPAYGTLPYLIVALAFGLAIIIIAYAIGNISGAHVNPAVSIGAYLSNRISAKELLGYIISQTIGAIIGSALLSVLFSIAGKTDQTGAFGANALPTTTALVPAAIPALLVEIILTFLFVLCVLGATDEKRGDTSKAGIIIGLALTAVHILGIGFTGTSVNPARSIGPAIFASANGNLQPIKDLWVFIVGPVIGACLASAVYSFLNTQETEKKDETDDDKIILIDKDENDIENNIDDNVKHISNESIPNHVTSKDNNNKNIKQEIAIGSDQINTKDDPNVVITTN